MKLLIVGSDKIYAIENFYTKYIRQAGTETDLFTAQNYFYAYYHGSLLHKLLYRAGLSNVSAKINRLFRDRVEQFHPDVIWIFKGMEIEPASLQWAKRQDIRLVNYNPDNPFVFTGKGSGNKNVTDSIPLYDLHFTYNLAIKKQLEEQYHAKTFFLPFGFDVSEAQYAESSSGTELNRACFLGNPDHERAAFLKSLLQKGIALDVYGNSWNRFIRHDHLRIYGPVYGAECWNVLRRYRVQLNLMRIHNEQSHNMRSFEIPGIGGIQLAPDTPEHRMFFKENEEIFLFHDAEECSEKINYLLGLSDSAARDIRKKAREKSLSAGYSYKDRAEDALHEMQRLTA